MKATWEAFEAALRPVMDDLERAHPGVLRAERQDVGSDPDLQAILWEADGSGTGVFMGDGWRSDAEAVVEIADKVQEAAIEAVWTATGVGSWPECPEHPGGTPLGAVLHEGHASWFCSTDNRVIAAIGSLGAS